MACVGEGAALATGQMFAAYMRSKRLKKREKFGLGGIYR